MEAGKSRGRLVWISVLAVAGLMFFYLYASRSPLESSSTAPSAGSNAESTVPSLPRHPAKIEPATAVGRDPSPQAATSEFKLTVNGVLITRASRAALISVDDRTEGVFVVGQQIVDGVVLDAVNPDRIVVKRGGDLVSVPLQSVRSRASAQSAAKALDELSAEGAEVVPIDLPPAGREERRTYQNRD